MLARSISLHCRPGSVDELVALVRDDVMPTVMGMDGNGGLSMLADRGSGRCIVTTSWTSPDAMAASGDYFGTARQRMCDVAGDDAPAVSRWEIALMHRVSEAGSSGCARVVWAHGGADVDTALDGWRTSVLPALEQLPGFCSASVLVDREQHRAVSSVVYADRQAMEGNAGAGAGLRDRFAAETGMTVDDVAGFDVVLAHLRVPEMA